MTDYMRELLDEYPSDAFHIDNDNKADWAVRQILKGRAETERLKAIADAEIAELNEKKKALQERQETRENHLKALLHAYFETVEKTTTKTQASYKLLNGKLVLKRQQPEYLRDEAALVGWAKDNAPAYVQVKESVAWGELKKATETQGDKVIYKDTGEVVPGVVAVERPDVFEVSK